MSSTQLYSSSIRLVLCTVDCVMPYMCQLDTESLSRRHFRQLIRRMTYCPGTVIVRCDRDAAEIFAPFARSIWIGRVCSVQPLSP